MFLVRRVCRTERANAWKVADILTKICNAYEEDGRDKATIYICLLYTSPSPRDRG